eukprot:MONOS_11312.1-p1 / transcript=MONOS_11312.1 / gene=MONOS_11312 / organism=Monocercomonoides_exilis_PA203 / gene_product=Serine / transcript_product=Serine / location=Mono_scaffold00561:38499-40993(-) / protein_length=773 / sequence_SO=supercontig / SO=protein_coding / is_pseudo=false
MKILDKDRIKDVADMERITREINVLKLLYHPNVIKLYEVIDTQRHIYIVTEYADGGELFDYIVHHGRLKEKEACRFFHMLMNGVDYCHQHYVIHRDLKPENLLLNSHRTLKIIDFGLSNRIKPGGLLKTACGSPCYAAPEMIEGKMYAGQMSDVWSCGVILFALVCGYLPFEDQNTQALYQKILNARYRCPSTLSSECKHLISKILNTDPTKRYTIAQIRQHPWYVDLFVGQTIEEVQIREDGTRGGQSRALGMTASTGGLDQVIDETIIQELEKLGFARDTTIMCIKAKKHNQIVAAYRLLLEKRMREAAEAGRQFVFTPLAEDGAASMAAGAATGPTAQPPSGSSAASASGDKVTAPTVTQVQKASPAQSASPISSANSQAVPPQAKSPFLDAQGKASSANTPSSAAASSSASSSVAPSSSTIPSAVPHTTVVVTTRPAMKPGEQDDAVMAAAKQAATQSRRRQSLFAGHTNAPPAITFTQDPAAKRGIVAKDETGKEIIPSSFTGSLAVGARPKQPQAVSALGALPDGDEEDEEDPEGAALLLQAQQAEQKRKAAAAAAAAAAQGHGASGVRATPSSVPSASASASSSSTPSSSTRPSVPAPAISEGEEMPAERLAAQQAAAKSAYASRRRTSVAATRDATSQLASIMEQKSKAKGEEEGKDGKEGAKEGQKDVRVFRGLFNVSATSSKPPQVILEEVTGLLKKKRIGFKRVEGSYVLKCEYPDKAIRFEIEICKLPRLEEVCFVNMKRISGETFAWKEFCTTFFSSMQL